MLCGLVLGGSAQAAGLEVFKTSSGNIVCEFDNGEVDRFIKSGLKPAPQDAVVAGGGIGLGCVKTWLQFNPWRMGVKSAVPRDWPARQEHPNDRTRRPAKAASPVGQEETSPVGTPEVLMLQFHRDRCHAWCIILAIHDRLLPTAYCLCFLPHTTLEELSPG
jgi:hypothetical protein